MHVYATTQMFNQVMLGLLILIIVQSATTLGGLQHTLIFDIPFVHGNDIRPYNNSKEQWLVVTETAIFLVNRTSNTSHLWFQPSNKTEFRCIININDSYYSLDTLNAIIRRHHPNGTLLEVWCGSGQSGNDTDCNSACFNKPYYMIFKDDYIHVTDSYNSRLVHIHFLTKAITITYVNFLPQSLCPSMHYPSTIWFSTYFGKISRLNTLNYTHTRILGTGSFGCQDSQIGTTASLGPQPYGCKEWGSFVYFLDKGCSSLRRFSIYPPHSVETIAGGQKACNSSIQPFNASQLNGPQNLLLVDNNLYSTQYYCGTITQFSFDTITDAVSADCPGEINGGKMASCYNQSWIIDSIEGDAYLNITGDTVINQDISVQWFQVTTAARVNTIGSVSGHSSILFINGTLQVAKNLNLSNSELTIDTTLSTITVDGTVTITNTIFKLIIDPLSISASAPLIMFHNISLYNVTVTVLNSTCQATLHYDKYTVSVILAPICFPSFLPVGLIIGVTVGGFALIALIAVFIVFYRFKSREAEVKSLDVKTKM